MNHARLCTRLAVLFASLLAMAAVSLVPRDASAQERFNLRYFAPQPSTRGGGFVTHSARALPQSNYDIGLIQNVAWSPFTLLNENGLTEGRLVGSVYALSAIAAFGVGHNFEAAGEIAMVHMGAGAEIPGYEPLTLDEATLGATDFRIIPKYTIFNTFGTSTRLPMAFAIIPEFSLPTGTQSSFSGDGGFRADPRIAYDLGFAQGHIFSVNLGYTVRPEVVIDTLEIDDALTFMSAADLRISRRLHLLGEINSALILADGIGLEEFPVEASAGGRIALGNWMITLGAGTGVSGGIGAADWRLVAGLMLIVDRPYYDFDADGVANEDDLCPREPEDFNGYFDRDGCPDEATRLIDEQNGGELCPEDPADFADLPWSVQRQCRALQRFGD